MWKRFKIGMIFAILLMVFTSVAITFMHRWNSIAEKQKTSLLKEAGKSEPTQDTPLSVLSNSSSFTRDVLPPNAKAPSSPARFPFDSLTAGRRPDKVEARMYQAQKWEPDLAKALSLPPGTRLERRSAFYDIPELKFRRVRVDRIYRMNRNMTLRNAGVPPARVLSVSPETPSSAGGTPETLTAGTAVAPQAAGPVAENGTRADEQPASDAEGELLWDNAMVADHLMVQTQLGITREQLARALPGGCRILSTVNAEKGLYLVAVPDEGERSLERAALALNHESLKKTIWFAEPDFLMGGADTTPNDPLFTTSGTDTMKQWGLTKIMAPRAWDVIKQPISRQVPNGSGGTITVSASVMASTTVVAVVDTGVDYTHPDLIPNLYVNPGESGGGKETNGLDDDANGKIDDYRGWNFVENTNNPMDDVGHGTHVAGIIGSAGNNAQGGSGVCWGVKMLPVRIIKKLGAGTYGVYSDAVAALDYLRTLNSPTKRIAAANHSWGGNGYSLAMLNAVNNPLLTADPLPDGVRGTYENDSNVITVTGTFTELSKIKIGMEFGGLGIPEKTVITIIDGGTLTLSNYSQQRVTNQPVCFANPITPKPYGIMHVAAAGNSRFNADRIPTYPASLPSGFMISVGATDPSDATAVWAGGAGSNFGRLNVDIFAPGSSIWSTKWKAPGDIDYDYESRNGTSMAAPFITASIALLKMWQPKLTDLQARQIVIDNADIVPGLQGKCLSGGRLNLAKVVDKLYQPMLVGSGGSTGGSGITVEALEGALALTGKIAVSSGHVLAVIGHNVFAWGQNSAGEAGYDPEDIWKYSPYEIPAFSEVRMVAAAQEFSMALKADGSVWVWGGNHWGMFGNGIAETGGAWMPHPVPQQVPGLSEIVWISAPASDCLAVKADGTVHAWGANMRGQLGDGTTTPHYSPQQIGGLADVVQASLSNSHGVAVTKTGAVFCWGQTGTHTGWNCLGDGNDPSAEPEPPQLVPGLPVIIQVAAGEEYSMALDQDGRVWQWGNFDHDGGGYPYAPGSHSPVIKAGLSGIVAIASSRDVFFAQNADGKIFSWGDASFGTRGNGSDAYTESASEVAAPLDDSITSVAAGDYAAVGMTADGKILSWGLNYNGILGIGRDGTYKEFPVQVRGKTGFSRVAGAYLKTYAVGEDGRLYRWGLFPQADGGISSLSYIQRPEWYGGLDSIADVVGSFPGGNWFAIKSDGTALSWGLYNEHGALGIGNVLPQSEPGAVGGLTGIVQIAPRLGLTYAEGTSVEFGDPQRDHVLAIDSSGHVFAWGSNEHGQLGDGTLTDRLSAVPLNGISSVTAVAAGGAHSLALKTDGTVWAWGRNHQGQLGDGSTTSRLVPVQVSGLAGIVSIGAAGHYSFAINAAGQAWAWGYVDRDFSYGFAEVHSQQLVPVLISDLPPVRQIVPSTESGGTFALTTTGLVYGWGDYASLARDPESSLPFQTPASVAGLSDVVYLDAKGRGVYAIKDDGSCWAFTTGENVSLGEGDSWANLPVYVLGFGAESATVSSLGANDVANSWLFSSFSAGELLQDAIVGDLADPDGDGVENLLEYALGLDPNEHDLSGLPLPRLDEMKAQSTSEGAGGGGQITLFSVDDCCFATPVGLEWDPLESTCRHASLSIL